MSTTTASLASAGTSDEVATGNVGRNPDVASKKKKVRKRASKHGERRLVEYFAVVTSKPAVERDSQADSAAAGEGDNDDGGEVEFVDDYDFQPVITARYPLTDHEDNPLQDSMTAFCHPDGNIRLLTEKCMPKAHYFVSTGGKGQYQYGTCLTIYEPYILSARSPSPKKGSKNGGDDNGDGSPRKKEVYLPKCLVVVSTYPYLSAFREYLVQLHRMSQMGDMPLPLERYIVNFCSEIPAPPPGSFEVQTTMLDSVIKFWCPPHNQPIPWVSLPFSHLFECLDIDNILTVWHCLALERQVLITSTQLSLLTECTEILLSMLFPMKWSHTYIPVLPHFLIPILSSPMPYLCGINKSNLAETLYDLSPDCVVVDLDSNLVTMGPSTESLPPLPTHFLRELRAKLDDNVDMVFREARSLTKVDDYSDRGVHLPSHVKMMSDAMWECRLCLFDEAFHLLFTPEMARKNILNGNDNSGVDMNENDMKYVIMSKEEKEGLRKQSQWDAVQEAFIDTYVYLLRNYRKFLVFPSKDNADASYASYGGAGFRSEEFVSSQRYDMQAFLRQLVGTQMFDDFITKRLYGSGTADVAFFDMAVDRFLKHSGIMSNVAVTGRIRRGGTAKGASSNGMGNGDRGRSGVHEKRSGIGRLLRSASPKRGKDKALTTSAATKKGEDPLLQSARVHRKLKTIVPPEPSGADLPDRALASIDSSSLQLGESKSAQLDDDDASVTSAGTQGTRSSVRSGGLTAANNPPNSPKSNVGTGAETDSLSGHPSSSYQRRHVKLKEEMERDRQNCYSYTTFPSRLDPELFGTPRPLPSAVLAEFDRQRQNAAQFRRIKGSEMDNIAGGLGGERGKAGQHLKKGQKNTVSVEAAHDKPPSAEVATFTVFFIAFTAVVGMELLEIADDPFRGKAGPEILSTYTHDLSILAESSDDETSLTTADSTANTTIDGEEQDAMPQSAESKEGEDADTTKERETVNISGTFDDLNDRWAGSEGSLEKPEQHDNSDPLKTPLTKNSKESNSETGKPRRRFRDNMSDLQIEEAKATSKAQLGLAFEMLDMIKKRGLKAEPESYQCLIGACGRCGDTERATQLLARMHEDEIVADGVVYSWLVTAFSAESAWRKLSGNTDEDLPDWANGASVEMDWNKLQKRSIRERMGRLVSDDPVTSERELANFSRTTMQSVRDYARKRFGDKKAPTPQKEKVVDVRKKTFVSEPVLRQILLGENLLEIVYPDISIDTDNELCPRCSTLLTDDDVVGGWSCQDSQDYTTKCPTCSQKFVPHFCVQSTSASFNGSRGLGTPLMCERLSPWVLQKELRTTMADREGIEDLLDPEWREKETKNAVLWWNLILSFMRYRFPFSFLLQGSFDTNLIAPTPVDDE